MKRILLVLLVILSLFSFTACGSEESLSQNNGINVTQPLQEDETADDISLPEIEEASEDGYAETVDTVLDSKQSSEVESAGLDQAGSNLLVVYFSRWGNTDYPDDIDVTTSASIVIDENTRFGTTEYVAERIAEETGADTYRVETVIPYTAVLSFLNEYDLSRKTIIPFCTHDGYGAGRSYQVIAQASHAAVSPDGIAIEAKDMITDWLADVGISGSQEQDMAGDETAIQITIGDLAVFEDFDSREEVIFSLAQ